MTLMRELREWQVNRATCTDADISKITFGSPITIRNQLNDFLARKLVIVTYKYIVVHDTYVMLRTYHATKQLESAK